MSNWKTLWAQNLTSLDEVCAYCHISSEDRSHFLSSSSFPLSLPRRLADKIEKGNIHDPIFRQFVSLSEEAKGLPGFCVDPLDEHLKRPCPNLLHKYPGRALLIATGACGMHCRFCFRRHFPHAKQTYDFSEELLFLRSHTEIEEVILSGGDPLSLSNIALHKLLAALESIKHIQRIRIHTRFLIGFPERIDQTLIKHLLHMRPRILLVLHINHPNEIDDDVSFALHNLQKAGVVLLSQTVLLRGVNDSLPVLEQLMKKLFSSYVLPYYLHQLDRVLGAHHFEVPIKEGLQLLQQLQGCLPGYMVPRYVQERANEKGKTLLHF